MKKFVLGCLLFCGSINLYADGEVTVYGYPYSSPSNLGAFSGAPSVPVSSGLNFGPGYYEAMAAKAAAEKKAAQIGSCIAAAQTRNNDNYDDVTERLALQSGDCQRELSHVPDAMAACIGQANGHFDENSRGLATQLKVDKEWCIKPMAANLRRN